MEKQPMERPFNLILAVDGSVYSWAAVKLVVDLHLERIPRVKVTVLTVLIPRNASDYAAREMLLKNTLDLLKEKGVNVSSEMLTGYPSEMLIQYAENNPPDLLVMGARGLRSSLGILLGGVAQQMVEAARWPVLIVRQAYSGLRRILLVTDGSEQSRCAGEFLGELPLPPGCEVKILHVLPPYELPEILLQPNPMAPEVFIPMRSSPLDQTNQQQALEEKAGHELIASTRTSLAEMGIESSGVLLRGDAATEIIEYAKANEIDLILSGSRGLGMVRSWLLGSVSRKIVHYGPCSVLVVKGG